MKKKLKVLVAFSALMICMSSCVYSLFPIYTDDTLVFLPELVGKWQDSYDEDDYILFEALDQEKEEDITINADVPSEYSDSMSGNGWSIKSGDTISITRNGVKITDRDAVKAHFDTLIGDKMVIKGGVEAVRSTLDSVENKLAPALKNLGDGLEKLAEGIKQAEKRIKGTAFVTKKESYKMVVMDDGEEVSYLAHVVSIGKEYFLDLYPMSEYSNLAFGQNLFPVHTFMKMDMKDGKLNLTMFDLEKLNKLFDSNLIRLRHENVDGTVLITAQPKEIQKFLEKYADDESVFESIETYARVVE